MQLGVLATTLPHRGRSYLTRASWLLVNVTSPPSLLFEGRNGVLRKLLILTALAATLLVVATTGTATAQARTHGVQVKVRKVYTGDWYIATRYVGRYYGHNVRDWLWNCSSSEGSHGGWVWFSNLKYPLYGLDRTHGGWMQFMRGTFNSNVEWAFRDARHRGLRASLRAKNYFEPLGQAIVAGAMYYYHGNPGTWTGVRC